MKQFKNVRGSMEVVPNVDVDKTTVYIRTNITRIEEEDFIGWQYDEIQYKKDAFIETLTRQEDSGMLALVLSMLMSEVDMLKSIVLGGN